MSWAEEARKLNLQINGLPTAVNTSTASAIAALPAAARSGSYADLLNKPSTFAPPIATESVLGGVKIGTGIAVGGDGTISIAALGGVQSFNTRTGAIVLTSGDVITALTYTPANAALRAVASGYASLDATTKIPLAQIPQIPMSNITMGTTFATVATTGSYNDLTNKPALAAVATSGAYSSLTGTPILATIATTGSYSDLSGKPTSFNPVIATASILGGVKVGAGLTITADGTLASTGGYTLPAATTTVLGGVKQGSGVTIAADGTLSAASAVTSVAGRTGAVSIAATDVSGLATVARTGIYSDLTGRPIVVSAFTNDAGYQTSAQVSAVVQAIVGTAPEALNTLQELAAALQADQSGITAINSTLSGKAEKTYVDTQLAEKVTAASLATVATTGSYNDLSNKYALPVATASVLGGVKQGSGIAIAGDGTISATGIAASTPYDIFFSTYGTNADAEVVHRFRAIRAFTIPTDFIGSSANSGVVAGASTVYTVLRNGVGVATITFGAGANTGTFSTQAALLFAIGDLFTVVTQATADVMLEDIDFSIMATLT